MIEFADIMNIPVTNIMEGFICNVLTDLVYLGYKNIRGIKKNNTKIKSNIYTEVHEFANNYVGTALDSGVFQEYISSSQVYDTIKNYLLYIGMGIVSENNQPKTEMEVINYLCENGILAYDVQLVKLSKNDMEGFFNQFFKTSKNIYYDCLNTSEKTMIHFINQKINRVELLLLEGMKFSIEKENLDYTNTVFQYTRTLRRNNQISFIYGYSEYKLNSFYVLPDLVNEKDKDTAENIIFQDRYMGFLCSTKQYIKIVCSWNNLFKNDNIIYVVGGPGYGKSLLLKNIINNYEEFNIVESKKYLVIFCDLKAYYRMAPSTAYPIVEFLRDSMIETTGMGKDEITLELIQNYLKRGRCLILFDALDEVTKGNREKIHTLVTGFFRENNPNNKICITSRDRGFMSKCDIEVYHILPLNNDKIKKYLIKMVDLKQFKKEDVHTFLEQAQPLLKSNFLNSFLTLSLLVKIYRSEKKLPQTKVELYSKCFDYINQTREKEKTEFDNKYDWKDLNKILKDSTFVDLAVLSTPGNIVLSENEIVEVLTKAYTKKFDNEGDAEEAIYKFLIFCSERTELFVPAPGEKKYRFFHRSFFDYFYSKYIVRFREPENILNEFMKFEIDSEVFELTTAMLKESDEKLYQELVEYVLLEAKKELNQKPSKHDVFGILITMMQVVDDIGYQKEFLYITCDNLQILDNIKQIKNSYLYSMILKKICLNNSELYKNFYDAYKHIIFPCISIEFDTIISRLDLSKDVNHNHLLYAFESFNGNMLSILLFYPAFLEDLKVYVAQLPAVMDSQFLEILSKYVNYTKILEYEDILVRYNNLLTYADKEWQVIKVILEKSFQKMEFDFYQESLTKSND